MKQQILWLSNLFKIIDDFPSTFGTVAEIAVGAGEAGTVSFNVAGEEVGLAGSSSHFITMINMIDMSYFYEGYQYIKLNQ